MFTAAELIEALRRRTRRSLRPPPPPGEFPPGWKAWFEAMAARPGRTVGAARDEIVALLAAREPAVSAAVVERMGRWRAFRLLWRQDWQPASSDERWMRIASTTATLVLHLLFTVMLAWLMFTRFHFPAPAEDAREGEEHVLQVEYVGEGTQEEGGSGATPSAVDEPGPQSGPAAAAPGPAVRAAVAAPPAEPRPEPPPEPVPEALPPPLPERPVVIDAPAIAPPAVTVPQVLQVTEVDVADRRFEVPPPREPAVVDLPPVEAPEVELRRRDVDARQDAVPRLAAPSTRDVELAVPERGPRGVAAVERRIELAEPARIDVRPVAAEVRAPGLPAVAPAEVQARSRELPMPAPRSDAAGAAPGSARSTASGETGSEAAPVAGAGSQPAGSGGRPPAGTGARESGQAAGAGQRTGQPPGAPPSSRAGDDWGDSTRNVPGRQAGTRGASGLFDADGRPRLADGGRVGGGLPPGTITEDFENIDRRGTWLKRPPYDYEPTSFDRFWLPSESLLEEWVRRSVTEVLIPIPGTTKTIRCVTVMLALGGGCGIVDPNLQEQPAGAREPPPVPFKPELQEAQDSLARPPER